MSTAMPLLVDDVATSRPKRTLSICLINPRFDPSYWGFEYQGFEAVITQAGRRLPVRATSR